MSTAASQHGPSAAVVSAGHQESDRLWGALSRTHERPPPPTGIDAFGAWIRRRALAPERISKTRVRADRILDASARLRSHSEAALDSVVHSAREAAVLHRDNPRAIESAFAVVVEVVRRTVGIELYPEQVMGGIVMARGAVAEMATGEGKTLTAILPAAIDAWSGRGVHILTVNDYLAKRDAEITSPAFTRLGIGVGYLQDETPPPERRRAYGMGVTYAADKQVIFDWLRDRLVSPVSPRLAEHLLDQVIGPADRESFEEIDPKWGSHVVQRGLYAAVIDEADSVLIDEAVTPAIVSKQDDESDESSEHHEAAWRLASQLERGMHYSVDEALRRISITPAGRTELTTRAGELPGFWSGPRRREEVVRTALEARELFDKGDDYIVRDGEIVIIDRSTGRILEGRQWQAGLHQAVEAKEGLKVSPDRSTNARVSYQGFFQRYARLSGMSGTVNEVADELWHVYGLHVRRVPTHRPIARIASSDRVFQTEAEKFEAVADRVGALHARRQPVLVGTRSINASERLGAMLAERGVPCRVLNAEREEEEADIVAAAGLPGTVTVATNMAGRGTDIKLTDESRALGGLVVVATERHHEARVDRQLAGRAGRQGDPGRSEAFVALDDQLIERHGLPPLRWAVLRASGWTKDRLSLLLWKQAQWISGRRAAAGRTIASRAEGWFELSTAEASR